MERCWLRVVRSWLGIALAVLSPAAVQRADLVSSELRIRTGEGRRC